MAGVFARATNGKVHRALERGRLIAMQTEFVVCVCDNSEFERDVEAIMTGRLALPTVSAVRLSLDGGVTSFEAPIYLTKEMFNGRACD